MPLLKEVIDEFKKGFHYLDNTDQRKNRWYEFWYKNAFLKNHCTDEKLTAAIETAVKKCNRELASLRSLLGEKNFTEVETAFLSIIAIALHTVQVQRFTAGTIATNNFQQDNQTVLERSLIPKKPSFFEEQLLAGLDAVKIKFPELLTAMDKLRQKIVASEKKTTLLFHESRKLIYGQMFYSATTHTELRNNYKDPQAREEYAKTAISKLEF